MYRWDVPHNIADLIELMNGKEQFVANLDQMFNESLGKVNLISILNYPIILAMWDNSPWRMSRLCIFLIFIVMLVSLGNSEAYPPVVKDVVSQ